MHVWCVVQLLDFSVSMKAWKSVHFLGHFLMLAIILVSMVNPPRRPRKKDVAKSDQEATPPIKTGASCLSRIASCCYP